MVSTTRKYEFGISLMVGVEGIEPGTESLFPLARPWHILEAAGRNFLRKNIRSLLVYGFGIWGDWMHLCINPRLEYSLKFF